MNQVLQHKILNGWSFFFLITAFSAVVAAIGYSCIGVATPEATVDMIRHSVQIAAPWIFITFVASSLAQLFPGYFTKWLLRNRRYLGLSFAAGMGWQLVFIGVLFAEHAWYYWEVLHKPLDLLGRIGSYAVLFALTVTSFFPVRRRMRREHWNWLHLFGVWYFFLAIWLSYLSMAVTDEVKTIDIVYTVVGAAALIIRLTAWRQRRRSEQLAAGATG